jgi:hypothetical protein
MQICARIRTHATVLGINPCFFTHDYISDPNFTRKWFKRCDERTDTHIMLERKLSNSPNL